MPTGHRPERPRRLRRVLLPIGALVGVVAAVAVTIVALKATSGRTCTGLLSLQVVVAPSTEGVVRQAADTFKASQPIVDGKCVQVQVNARSSADVARELPTTQINPPALWLSDSSLWPQQVVADAVPGSPTLDIRPSLATSPLVVAASAPSAGKLGWPVSQVSWQRIIDGSVPAVLSDPTTTTEGLLTLTLMRGLLGNPDGTPKAELVDALLRIGRSTLTTVQDGFGKVSQGPDTAPVFTATEQSVLATNRQAGKREAVAVYPQEGTVSLDHPLVRVTRATEPPGTGEAANAFEQVLRSSDTAKRFADAGFRDTKGAAPTSWRDADGVRGDLPRTLPAPNAKQVSELLKTWTVLNLDARMLTVLDVSAPTKQKAPTGQSKVELERDAALRALGMLPDTTQIGLWAFSTQQTPTTDWTELVGLGPLGEQVGAGPRRAALQSGLTRLPSLVKGGSALFDTTLAAVQSVRRAYDPVKVNSVVLITNGRNDNPQGIDLPTLLDRLRAQVDKARPLPVITIGIGPDADMDALRQIASITGGKAYQAQEPGDIQNVLLDAMSQRSCRPNC
ncbi:VWA domain-containing protein [Solihabitans fulvus]|uniref:VWA domain-containing protein n=1 Tax=Solihabitans fulvus TaxID=1892852 RepID=A0A5B2XGY6_9PSEU|nr:substrate-binding and VWA domain-containing protein [Solihabitans fulvus]KAA2262305.1 VWA domain-containing protein [Solihabitans fulvus]